MLHTKIKTSTSFEIFNIRLGEFKPSLLKSKSFQCKTASEMNHDGDNRKNLPNFPNKGQSIPLYILIFDMLPWLTSNDLKKLDYD